jgi:hypothetical protein
VLISARQLGANYRPAEIIRAFAALDHKLGRDSYLIMRTFGHGIGVSLTELHSLADLLKVSDRIRWILLHLPSSHARARTRARGTPVDRSGEPNIAADSAHSELGVPPKGS